jgi:glutathionyl-hydroquinone reductase
MTSTETRRGDFPAEQSDDGAFRRKDSRFREWVRADGSTPYRPAAGRYHLYVSTACPWAHRTIIYRHLKGLEDAISMTIVDPERDERGWAITNTRGTTPDPVNNFTFLSEAYAITDPDFDGRVTVPVLWDRELGRIVNNESADIIRMLDREFDAFAGHPDLHYCPDELRAEIDEINHLVYENVNDGVYRTGFAATQTAYEYAFGKLFDALDELEARLSTRRWLVGGRISEADWRLFTTLLRFDPVYVGHFQCNLRRIVDYPALSGYLRELYQHPGIAETVDMDHIKRHYYRTHPQINPMFIVPAGPALDLTAPHGRDHLNT